MALTRSRLMNFWKTVMPCSLVDALRLDQHVELRPAAAGDLLDPGLDAGALQGRRTRQLQPVRLSAAADRCPSPDAGASEPLVLACARGAATGKRPPAREAQWGLLPVEGCCVIAKRGGSQDWQVAHRLEECRSLEGVRSRCPCGHRSAERRAGSQLPRTASPRSHAAAANPPTQRTSFTWRRKPKARQGQRFALRVPTGKRRCEPLHPTGERIDKCR